MKNILHIFNGDSSYELFRKNKSLEGTCMVWREMLCDGQTIYEVGSEEFWNIRTTFYERELSVEPQTYEVYTIGEFEKVDIHEFHEIILWFEYDLFCQINRLALISYFYQESYEGEVSIVNLLSYQEKPYTGLGELNASEYPQLMANRRRISRNSIEMADMYWFHFCSDNHEELIELASLIKFPFLEETTKLLIERFNKQYGITYFERRILESINLSGNKVQNFYHTMLSESRKEGYGDIQIKWALKSLHMYYNTQEASIELNKKGKDLLNGHLSHTNDLFPSFIGGRKH